MKCDRLTICFRRAWNFEKIIKVIRVLIVLEAILLVVIGVFRLVNFMKIGSFPNYVITFYLFLIAIVMAMIEFRVQYFRQIFYFLNFCWGKALLLFFCSTLVITYRVNSTLELVSGIVILVSAFFLVGISVIFRKEEKDMMECDVLTLDPQISFNPEQNKGVDENLAGRVNPEETDSQSENWRI